MKRSLQKNTIVKTTLRLLMLAIVPLMLTSCFSTRYVSNETDLKRNYADAHVEDVTFDFGKPSEVNESQRGYTYLYNERIANEKVVIKNNQYVRFSFDNEDIVRNVQSTTTKKTRRFSAVKTFLGLPFAIVGGIVVVTFGLAAAAN